MDAYLYPALALLIAAAVLFYNYRQEREMPCQAYIKGKYGTYAFFILVCCALPLLRLFVDDVRVLAAFFCFCCAGGLVLLARAVQSLIRYLVAHGLKAYTDRPLWVYRFYLWTARIMTPVFILIGILCLFVPQ